MYKVGDWVNELDFGLGQIEQVDADDTLPYWVVFTTGECLWLDGADMTPAKNTNILEIINNL